MSKKGRRTQKHFFNYKLLLSSRTIGTGPVVISTTAALKVGLASTLGRINIQTIYM